MTKNIECSSITRLQSWYVGQCDVEEEYLHSVRIENISNPGWAIEIELFGTNLEFKNFRRIKIQRDDEHDWMSCSVSEGVFKAYGGPRNLSEMIDRFLDWINEDNGAEKI